MKTSSFDPLPIYKRARELTTVLALLPISLPGLVAEPGDSPALQAPPTPFVEEALRDGQILFDLRARYEFAEQSPLENSHAATVRTRLGYTTKPTLPLAATIEFEDIRALDGDAYNQAGLNGEPQRTVVADPETTELNQAFVHLQHDGFSARLGRQRFLIDNERFIGNVGWRQNEQTFDAATLQYRIEDGPTLVYAYLDQIHRVFGREHPDGTWDSHSHILHAKSPLGESGSLGVYGYRLELDQAPVMSGDTIGAWARPNFSTYSIPTTLHMEIAHQTDNSATASASDFDHFYIRTEIQTTFDPFTLGGGWERLEGDGQTAFQTPLATLHAFNGWADQFTTTPANGLDDLFAHTSLKLPTKITLRIAAHRFSSQRDDQIYGHELDLLLSRPLGRNTTLLAKAALFDGKDRRPDVTKFWIQADVRLGTDARR